MDAIQPFPPITQPVEAPKRTARSRSVSKVEGYFLLGATMIGAVALSSFVVGKLPKGAPEFTGAIISQIFGIAIYGLGAPLFEPATSKFRQRAFGLSRELDESFEGRSPTELEQFWWRTQANYSQNGQMARNIISHFLVSIQDNVSSAHRAITASDGAGNGYAAARVAEAALRMRTLFTEFRPDEPAVAVSVQSGLADHLTEDQCRALRLEILSRLEQMDAHFGEVGVKGYYDRMLAAWLPA